VIIRHPKIATIDCNHCATVAYKLDAGEGQGLPILNGEHMIPVRHPPCYDDDTVCPKVRPGHSDLSETAQDIYDDWRLAKALDEPPKGPWAKVYHGLLDRLVAQIQGEDIERRQAEIAALARSVNRRN